jgi:hypothetical protein
MKISKYMILAWLFVSAIFASVSHNCLDFSDPDDYVLIDQTPLEFNSKFTIECWFNIREFSDSAAIIDFSSKNIYAGRTFGYGIYTRKNNRIAIEMGNLSGSFEMLLDDIKENVWYHLAVTYNKFKRDENVVAFLNGRAVKKGDCDLYLDYPETFRPYGVILGAYYDYPVLKAIDGQIDEVRFWSLIRTNDEIRSNMSKTVDPDSPGLKGYYTFDQAPDLLVTDLSSNANHGMLNNMSADDWQLSYAQLAVEPAYDVTFDRIVLPWSTSSVFNSYCVDMSTDTNFSTSLDGYPKTDVDTDYHIADDLTPGTYYFRVKGHYEGETLDLEPWTDVQSASTLGDAPTPIELSSFSVKLDGNTAVIDWVTSSQSENALFILEKRSDNTDWYVLNKTAGAGTSSETMNYAYRDADVKSGARVYYRLKDVSYSGEIGLSEVIELAVPDDFEEDKRQDLISIFPNPFNPSTCISLDLNRDAHVRLTVHDINGKIVDELCNDHMIKGNYDIHWQPDLPTGIYILKLHFDQLKKTYKLLYIK